MSTPLPRPPLCVSRETLITFALTTIVRLQLRSPPLFRGTWHCRCSPIRRNSLRSQRASASRICRPLFHKCTATALLRWTLEASRRERGAPAAITTSSRAEVGEALRSLEVSMCRPTREQFHRRRRSNALHRPSNISAVRLSLTRSPKRLITSPEDQAPTDPAPSNPPRPPTLA